MSNTKNTKNLERETINDYFKFYNELAEKYPESKIVYDTKMGITRKSYLIKLLKKDPESLTLDLGCNDGPYKPHIKRYVGLDIASACLKKFKAPRLQALAQNFPFRKNVFERILAFEVLEHIWGRNQVLRECHRVLKRNGKLIVSVPYGKNPYQIRPESGTKRHRNYGVKYIPYVHGKFSKEDVRALMEKNGFTIKRIEQLEKYNVVAIGLRK